MPFFLQQIPKILCCCGKDVSKTMFHTQRKLYALALFQQQLEMLLLASTQLWLSLKLYGPHSYPVHKLLHLSLHVLPQSSRIVHHLQLILHLCYLLRISTHQRWWNQHLSGNDSRHLNWSHSGHNLWNRKHQFFKTSSWFHHSLGGGAIWSHLRVRILCFYLIVSSR